VRADQTIGTPRSRGDLGTGQFCTNPGLLFVPEDSTLVTAVGDAVAVSSGGPMLSARIFSPLIRMLSP
jgi:NADP-dependent aldehyde dehydrogenase